MKKVVSIALMVALLLVAAVAIADTELTVPSKTTDDLAEATAAVANPVEGKTPAVSFNVADDAPQAIAAEAELAKVQAAGTLEGYFNAETVAAVQAILGEGEISMDEFLPFVITDYEEAMGDLIITAKFATPYENGEKVAVLVGLVGEDGAVAWTVYEGVGLADGSVQFTVEPATALAIVNGTALLNVLSK